MRDLTILARRRHLHMGRVLDGHCPVCGAEGTYDKREFLHHCRVFFYCKSCGYELREHVMKEMEDGTTTGGQQEAVSGEEDRAAPDTEGG